MYAVKPSLYLTSCKSTVRFTQPSLSRFRSHSVSSFFVKQLRKRTSSSRNTPNSPTSPDQSRRLLIALPGLCLLGYAYKYFNPEFDRPLALDALDPEIKHAKQIANVPFVPLPKTIEDANECLKWEENSDLVGVTSDVLRYDSVRIPSNVQCEDEYIYEAGTLRLVPDHISEDFQWSLWGIFDGHVGSETSSFLQSYFTLYLFTHLVTLLPPSPLSSISASPAHQIDGAITSAFLAIDATIIERGAAAALGPRFLGDALGDLSAGYAGSCALVSLYDCCSRLLRVACVGDSRAVLGRRNAAGKYEAVPLSMDQTGFNEDEAKRIRDEHPGEDGVIKDGRLLGLAVTRAFGDGRWKWSRDVQDKAWRRFYGPTPREGCLTPPYLTAEPVITTTKIQPENRDFLIMASDGLWDNLTSEQAVDLVERWLKTHDPEKPPAPQDSMGLLTFPAADDKLKEAKPDIGKCYTDKPLANEKDFVVLDENAATHLARNALGGGNEDVLRGVLTALAPLSRQIRDDITVQVIFFWGRKGQEEGGVEIENF